MPTLRVKITGAKFHEGAEERVASLMPGKPVTLMRDPRNAFDQRCVEVHIDDVMSGYVPKFRNRDLAAAMDASKDVAAEATEIPGEISINWKD